MKPSRLFQKSHAYLVALVLVSAFSLSVIVRGAQKQEIFDLRNYAMIELDSHGYSEVMETRNFIQSVGGQVAIIASTNVMFGWIDHTLVTTLIGMHHIKAVYYEPVAESQLAVQDENSLRAVQYFRTLFDTHGNFSTVLRADSVPRWRYLDGLEHPSVSYDDYLQNLRNAGMDPSKLQRQGKLLSVGPGAKVMGNSDTMTGTATVCLFFVESNGSIDPDQYTWTSTDETGVYNQIVNGLVFWSNQAVWYGKSITFNVVSHYHTDPACQQGYEPTKYPSSQDSKWINAIMGNLGYTSGSKISRVTAFDTWLWSNYGTDWAYSAFIAYNPSPAPSTFTDGYFAYSYVGGPYTQLLFRNDGWGTSNFGLVFTHETGHMFYASDEYYQPGYGGCTGTGLWHNNIDNGNCENGNPASVDCMMKGNSYSLCAWTPGHIGWTSQVYLTTVATNPSGLRFNVSNAESSSYTAPQTFGWGLQSTPTVGVNSPQTANGTVYGYTTWSDGGTETHNISVTGTASYTSNFQPLTITMYFVGGAVATGPMYVFDVFVMANGAVNMGSASLVFGYNTSGFGTNAPATLTPNNYSGGNYAAMALADFSATKKSINIQLNLANNGAAIAALYPGTRVGTIAMNIVNPNGAANLSWDVASSSVHAQDNTTLVPVASGGGDNSPLPIQLVTLVANVKERAVHIEWTTASEKDNYGFEIGRKLLSPQSPHPLAGLPSNGLDTAWTKVGFVGGHGTTLDPQKYEFVDKPSVSGRYAYQLKQLDLDGTFAQVGSVEVDVEAPKALALYQNYPNPFNPTTTLEYSIPEACYVTLKLYDVLGRVVKTFVDQPQEPGVYEVPFEASSLASGVYFYRMAAGPSVMLRKMLILR
jgi:hypothetical protein